MSVALFLQRSAYHHDIYLEDYNVDSTRNNVVLFYILCDLKIKLPQTFAITWLFTINANRSA